MGDQGVQSHGLNFKRKKTQGAVAEGFGKGCQREQAGHMKVEGNQFQGFKVRTRVQHPHSRPAMVVCTMIQAYV